MHSWGIVAFRQNENVQGEIVIPGKEKTEKGLDSRTLALLRPDVNKDVAIRLFREVKS